MIDLASAFRKISALRVYTENYSVCRINAYGDNKIIIIIFQLGKLTKCVSFSVEHSPNKEGDRERETNIIIITLETSNKVLFVQVVSISKQI